MSLTPLDGFNLRKTAEAGISQPGLMVTAGFLGAVRRLRNYQEVTGLTIADFLAKCDELDYAFAMERKDKGRFIVWCEAHPEVDIESERAKGQAGGL